MITSDSVVSHILDYLNGRIGLNVLVQWAENALFTLTEQESDVPNTPALMSILGYVGAGDTPYFPLTWEKLIGFLDQLGVKVHVTAEVG